MDDEQSPAYRLGYEAGKSAASWVFDGNTTRETYGRVLKGIEDGDPAVLDLYRVPDLSGEYAGDYNPADLAEDLGLDYNEDADDVDTACDAWENGANDGFWHEVERIARYMLA